MNCGTVGSSPRAFQGKLRAKLLTFLASTIARSGDVNTASQRYSLHSGERGNEVFDDIVGMFQPAREPHQTIANAELGAGGGRETLMRGGRRMRDQALGVAEIIADLHEPERILEAEGGSLAAWHL